MWAECGTKFKISFIYTELIAQEIVCLQNMQNTFRMVVTDKRLERTKKSPNEPNRMPAKNRAKYGRLAKMPALAKLNLSTSFMNLGAPVSRKYSPQRLP